MLWAITAYGGLERRVAIEFEKHRENSDLGR
jgi:hypothetical protein